MGTKSEIQAAAYRAEQRQREAESHRRANIRGESTWFPKSERPAPAPPATNGLRTERVVLEITHSEPTRADSWGWGSRLCPWLRPGESVRVVDESAEAVAQSVAWEGARDAYRGRIARLTDERDAAIRKRDTLRGQLESVADRAAAAETALESAPAASEWRMLDPGEMPQIDDHYYEEFDGQWCLVYARNLHLFTLPHRHKYRRRVPAPAASDVPGTEAMRELKDAAVCLPHCGGERLQRAIAAAERLLTQPQPSVPASGVPGTEVGK